MPRFVFDLDGTICTQQKSGEYHLAKPIQKMIEKVRQLHERKYTIIIYTARGMNTYGGDVNRIPLGFQIETVKWLKENNVPYDELVFGKPAGDIYIDDKGVNALEFLDIDL